QFNLPVPANAPAARSHGAAGRGIPNCSIKTAANRTAEPCRTKNSRLSLMNFQALSEAAVRQDLLPSPRRLIAPSRQRNDGTQLQDWLRHHELPERLPARFLPSLIGSTKSGRSKFFAFAVLPQSAEGKDHCYENNHQAQRNLVHKRFGFSIAGGIGIRERLQDSSSASSENLPPPEKTITTMVRV